MFQELKKMLSIRVFEWSVIQVGCKIWGWKLKDPKIFKKPSVSGWESSLRKSRLKSPKMMQNLFSLSILCKTSSLIYCNVSQQNMSAKDISYMLLTTCWPLAPVLQLLPFAFFRNLEATLLYIITPILKSLVVPVIWLALIGAIYSWITPFFCFKSHLFPSQWAGHTKNKQPIRFQGLFKVTNKIARKWYTKSIIWQILLLLFPKLLLPPPTPPKNG